MDEQKFNPNTEGLIPPIQADLVICGPNLSDIILLAIEAVALGMDPRKAADETALQLCDLFIDRIQFGALSALTLPAAFGPGGMN